MVIDIFKNCIPEQKLCVLSEAQLAPHAGVTISELSPTSYDPTCAKEIGENITDLLEMGFERREQEE